MRVLVCGGRNYCHVLRISNVLDQYPITTLIEGGASGADHHAGQWASRRGVDRVTYWANWKGDGKAAGPLRNTRMLLEGRPDLVIAFPGGAGTANMIAQAVRKGVPVCTVSDTPDEITAEK